MVCLLFAMEKEASELLKNVEILENRCVGYTEIFEVEKDEKKFLVAISGIGKGFAASAIPRSPICIKSILSSMSALPEAKTKRRRISSPQ